MAQHISWQLLGNFLARRSDDLLVDEIANGVAAHFGEFKIAFIEKAIERKTGARGLRSILEKIMTDIMYDIPSRGDVRKCIITKGTIEHETLPTLVLEDPEKAKKDTAS